MNGGLSLLGYRPSISSASQLVKRRAVYTCHGC